MLVARLQKAATATWKFDESLRWMRCFSNNVKIFVAVLPVIIRIQLIVFCFKQTQLEEG